MNALKGKVSNSTISLFMRAKYLNVKNVTLKQLLGKN